MDNLPTHIKADKDKRMELAISSIRKVLGDNRVSIETDTYEVTTFDSNIKVSAVVFPANAQEVSECMKVANEFKVGIYPVSGGKNYGLGSTVPNISGSIIVDLKMLDEISDYNEDLAYVTLGAGVSFRQLEQFLEDQGGHMMMDGIGSTPHASIVGNTVERGHGMGLYADRLDKVCALEVVLPNGSIINTGFGRYGKNKLAKLSKWGLGPSLDGIFTQSSFGIVTSLTMWLKPRPRHFQSILIHASSDEKMSSMVDKFRQMRLEGLNVSIRIFNDYRLVAFSSQYHEVKKGSQGYLTQEEIDKIKPEGTGKWIGIGGLYSYSKLHARAEREFILNSLEKYDLTIDFIDKEEADLRIKQDPSKKEEMDFFYYKSSLAGYTTDKAIHMCYWRVPKSISDKKDIHKDECGLFWYCPSIPCTGEDAVIAANRIREICYKYSLEPNVGFLFISERALDITGAICFDKSQSEESKRAAKCHDEILESLCELGYPPYRLGIQSMNFFKKTETDSIHLLTKIKTAIDPNNVLSSKRYSTL
ncbi:MAG: FAD-binding oxidoreductase [Bacteroidota bacterium]